MIEHEILADDRIVVVKPLEKLTEEDFAGLASAVDPFLDAHGALRGLLLDAEHFPGWEDFAGFVSHMRFVRDHHRKIERVALATDAKIPTFLPKLVDHFVAADIRQFPHAQRDAALAWLRAAP